MPETKFWMELEKTWISYYSMIFIIRNSRIQRFFRPENFSGPKSYEWLILYRYQERNKDYDLFMWVWFEGWVSFQSSKPGPMILEK